MPGPKPGALPLGDTPLVPQLTEYSTGQQVSVKNLYIIDSFSKTSTTDVEFIVQEGQKKNRRLAVFRLGSFFDLLLTPLYNNFSIRIVNR
jgi:hypothetical protein